MTSLALNRRSVNRLVHGAVLAGLGLALFWPTLQWMAERFDAHDSFYSHGWLIPFASGWLIWQRREQLSGVPVTPSWRGLALLIPALSVHALATVWHIGFVAALAMLAAIVGVLWVYGGGRLAWALRMPLAFLLFMVPLPGVLLIGISFHMKLAAAALATQAVRLMGIPVQQAGSTLQLPGVAIMVDDTCSGLRSLISLVALATLWSTLLPAGSRRWQRLTIVASSIPIALAANMVRIMLLILIALVYGPKAAQGFVHTSSGFVVFGVAVAALVGVSRGVQRWSPAPDPR